METALSLTLVLVEEGVLTLEQAVNLAAMDTLAQAFEAYFTRSEQLPTLIHLVGRDEEEFRTVMLSEREHGLAGRIAPALRCVADRFESRRRKIGERLGPRQQRREIVIGNVDGEGRRGHAVHHKPFMGFAA